jgi:hypothetical protein
METLDLMSTLKWKELAEAEEYLDLPMDEWGEAKSKAKVSFAIQYILAKRNNEKLTIEEAEKLTIKELGDMAGVEIALPKDSNQL